MEDHGMRGRETPPPTKKSRVHPSSWPAYGPFVALLLITLVPPYRIEQLARFDSVHWLDWLVSWRWIPALLVSMPFWLAVIASLRLRQLSSEVKDDFELAIGPFPRWPTAHPSAHELAQQRWQQVAAAASATWHYERRRHLRSLQRLGLNVLIFGDLITFVLACCTLVFFHPEWTLSGSSERLRLLMVSIAAAASTSYLVRFVRAVVRISSGDITCRMFAWAARSVALVVVADVGLFVLFQGNVNTVERALLLGLFAGATCDRALEIVLDKAAALFKTTLPPARGPSPLLSLEGITPEHVERLEEEDIYSIHDLAFVPTARLFFATAHSLHQICDWQDRALLQVYVGAAGVKGLEQRMKIIDASDLLYCAHNVLYGTLGEDERKRLKEQLLIALDIEEGGLEQLLASMAHDELTMRLRLYWQSSVLTQEAQQRGRRGAAAGEPAAVPVQLHET